MRLRKNEERRLLRGHPWVFANEVASSLREHAPGDVVDVVDWRGRPVGRGTVNPHALIAVRLFSTAPAPPAGPDPETLARRLAEADALRRAALRPLPPAYRLAHGEADFLPGLVVDRYGDVLAVQALTAGMDRRLEAVADALMALLSPRAVVARNDAPVRALEGLPASVRVMRGSLAGPVALEEALAPGRDPLRLEVDVLAGQKTGAFLDQRANLAAALPLVEGASVLDLCCYDGSWSLAAARAGARSCLGLDSSQEALQRAAATAAHNGLGDRCRFQREDLFDGLRRLRQEGERFQVVFLDPPAFVKRRARLAEGIKGYITANRRAMELLEPGGWLVTSSCSHHLDRANFRDMLRTAAFQARRTLRWLELRGARADHPVLAAAPETEYLKCAIAQVL